MTGTGSCHLLHSDTGGNEDRFSEQHYFDILERPLRGHWIHNKNDRKNNLSMKTAEANALTQKSTKLAIVLANRFMVSYTRVSIDLID
jgi:hypothetical protein